MPPKVLILGGYGNTGALIVVVASSTLDYAHNVSSLALEAGVDYLDVQLSFPERLRD